MDYRILGPVKVRARYGYCSVSGSRHRKILATMILGANHLVSTRRLVDVLWGELPPRTAVQQVQNCVGTLRQRLAEIGLIAELKRSSDGYLFLVPDEQIDANEFTRMCARADSSAQRGYLEEASQTLRQALGLWFGEPLQDVVSEALAPAVVELEETRVRAVERLAQVEIARGNHSGVLAELSRSVCRYPYHEGLHGHLAVALHRSGRTADGLRVLHALRARLRDEVGIETGPFIEKTQRELLGTGLHTGARHPYPAADGDVLHLVRSALDQLATAVELLSAQGRPAGPAPLRRGDLPVGAVRHHPGSPVRRAS